MTDLKIELDLRGLRSFDGRFAKATEELMRRQASVAESAARRVLVPALKRHCPVGVAYTPEGQAVESGELGKSIRLGGRRTIPTRAGGVWGTSQEIVMAQHGRWTLYPTKPHIIFPRSGRCLRFWWQGIPGSARARLARTLRNIGPEGATVHLAYVRHPGTMGKRWDLEAFAEVEQELRQELLKTCAKFALDLRGG